MHAIRIIGLITLCGSLFIFRSTGLYKNPSQLPFPFQTEHLTASSTYLGPTSPALEDKHLVKVEILIRDSAEASGVQIVSVEFNKTPIPLKPRDIYGNRGSASFQVKPGKYQLRWKVNRDKFEWPRTVKHEEEVTISPRDLWIQISIEGDEASIS